MTSRPLVRFVGFVCSFGWIASAHASPMRVIWDGPPCIATEIRIPNRDDLDSSKMVLTVIKPLHWSNLAFSSIVSIKFSSEPFSSNYDRAQDEVKVESGKTHSGEAQIGTGALQLKCIGEYENFTEVAALPRTPGAAKYHLWGVERVDNAAVATAMAQQQANNEYRAAANAEARQQATKAGAYSNTLALLVKQDEDAAANANAALMNQMRQQAVGSTLFCSTDPHWPRAPGDAVDRQRLVCHLTGTPNFPPTMGAALLTSGWTIVSESRRTEHNVIIVDMGTVEITEVRLRKDF